MRSFFSTDTPSPSAVAGHLFGLMAAAVLVGTFAPEAEPLRAPMTPNAWNYELLNKDACRQIVDRIVSGARRSGEPAWVWVDESQLDGYVKALAMAGRMEAVAQNSVHLVVANRFAHPVPTKPVPRAFATDDATIPTDACSFTLNTVHSVPKI
jgi:hypothetical protein